MTFEIKSKDFNNKGEIPSRFTCEGENISPELHWINTPENTKAFALIVDDPDAPDPAAPKMTYVHWVAYDIPAQSSQLPQKIPADKNLPGGGISGVNDYKLFGYKGPCPPIGTHRYFFKLYALDNPLKLPPGKTKNEVLRAMQGHVIGEAVLMGTYKKKR